MKNYLQVSLLAVLFSTVIQTQGFPQDRQGQGGGQDVFGDIKAQMVSSSEENKRLAEENKALKAQLIGLQLEVDQYQREIERLDPGYMKAMKEEKQQKETPTPLSGLTSDDLIREAQDIYLSGRTMNLDGVERLRELQLYDLQYQKQELELDLKLMEFLKQKAKEQRDPETDALKNKIRENTNAINDLSARMAREEKAAMAYPQDIDLLKMENKALEDKIQQLKRLLK